MKRYVEIEPICPFIGKPCIRDGWTNWDQKTLRPCAFYDDSTYKEIDTEPCRIKRAINKLLDDEGSDDDICPVDVPWDIEKKEK